MDDFPADPAEAPEGWRESEQRFRDDHGPSGGAYGDTPRKPGTTRFVGFIKADRNTEAGMLPDEPLLTAMGVLMEEMTKAGVLLAGEGLQPSAKGARVRFAGARRMVTDGPFPETKELVAGYCLMQVASKAEAIEWASRMLRIHVEGTHVAEAEVEVRQVFELEELPPSAVVEREVQLRAELASLPTSRT